MNLQLRPALVSFIALSVITGLAYPLVITGLSKAIFRKQAAGSLIKADGKVIGSELIGQSFTAPKDFWSRPSATVDANGKPLPYNGANSGGSNLAPSNPDLKKAVEERIAALRAADPDTTGPVPVDLVTTSASGLDPHISPAAAAYQVHRVAKARGLDEAKVRDLVAAHTQGPQWGVLGDARVNVLKLNLALEALSSK
ncbi:MAG: potassium-transporting ATPase subunit KdpC [Geothrix sp.]|uniref:potassium-transporting ATPase subunit KdpC n=1 Tax=Geothrix sp. TaxID=1962974 RepID=UPI00184E633A|nr:potassium-transporting ATPase subunit KdpC [Geothrix sp.]NWJ41003.1 potassium-transporting ATPase subunit KdpC [Geothrix sp.]WIL21000.1 MAG: potassium-transporting ATPase subunit KdpC [Geothrix sp.]